MTPALGMLLVAAAPLIAFLVIVTAPLLLLRMRRLARMRRERPGEGICTFARAFDRRGTDPFVIRAVHEQLQPYFMAGGAPVPIRPSDRLYEDMGIDGGELDDVAEVVARRAGRSLNGAARNPVRSVDTVGDLVRFFVHQPRVGTGGPPPRR